MHFLRNICICPARAKNFRGVVWTAALALVLGAAGSAHAIVVRFQFTIPKMVSNVITPFVETVDVRLYNTTMPRSVTNFLHYVDDNDWDGSVIHRRSAPADSGVSVVQGGGYYVPAAGALSYTTVPKDAAILDEPGGGVAGPSNLKGTIAYAKSGPNTATSEWYFNYTDNTALDAPTPANAGGFSAFGRIVGAGQTTIDDIVAMQIAHGPGPFGTLPVVDAALVAQQNNAFPKDVVTTNDVRRLNIPDGDYNFDGKVDAADLTVWKTNVGSTTKAEADGNGNGVVDGADLLIWQRTLGQNFGTPTVAGVPEPGTAAMAFLGALSLGALRRSIARRSA